MTTIVVQSLGYAVENTNLYMSSSDLCVCHGTCTPFLQISKCNKNSEVGVVVQWLGIIAALAETLRFTSQLTQKLAHNSLKLQPKRIR